MNKQTRHVKGFLSLGSPDKAKKPPTVANCLTRPEHKASNSTQQHPTAPNSSQQHQAACYHAIHFQTPNHNQLLITMIPALKSNNTLATVHHTHQILAPNAQELLAAKKARWCSIESSSSKLSKTLIFAKSFTSSLLNLL